MRPWAQLIESSPFFGIFARGRAPVCTASPVPALLEMGESCEQTMVYFLDLARCAGETLQRVAEICAQEVATLHTPEELEALSSEALLQMCERGLPIRESQVEGIIGEGVAT